MNRLSTVAFSAALLVSGLAATPTPGPFAQPAASPAATPTPDPAIVARARKLFGEIQAGKLDRTQLDDSAAADITDEKIKQAQSLLQPLGTPVTFEQTRVLSREGLTAYVYLVAFGSGQSYDFSMVVDSKGKIAGLQIFPPQ